MSGSVRFGSISVWSQGLTAWRVLVAAFAVLLAFDPAAAQPGPQPFPVQPPAGTLVFHCKLQGQLDLFVSDDGSRTARNLTDHPAEDSAPALSPDGTRVAFQSTRSGKCHIFVMPLAGGPVTTLTTGSGLEQSPVWSPDGAWLYFDGHRDSAWRLCRVPAAGGVVEVLTGPELDALSPAVSPDGKSLACQMRKAGDETWNIGLLGPDGKLRAELTAPGASFNETPVFSADGRWVLFAAAARDGYDLYRVSSSGTGPVQRLTDTGGWKLHPEPAGDRLVLFDARTPAGWRIALLDLQTGATRILSSSRDCFHPSWRAARR
ncbi:MAG: PD40 domain-containing protein [Candidatus Riflebacteria bacterium]|nr:PD40 domain-containing protein [Candidatus Riflebacteria bacterium]